MRCTGRGSSSLSVNEVDMHCCPKGLMTNRLSGVFVELRHRQFQKMVEINWFNAREDVQPKDAKR